MINNRDAEISTRCLDDGRYEASIAGFRVIAADAARAREIVRRLVNVNGVPATAPADGEIRLSRK